MKKILITSNTSWFIYNFFRSTIKELLELNFEIYALAPKDKYSDLLVELKCKYIDINLDRTGLNAIKELKANKQIYNTLKEIRPDCVLNFTIKLNIYTVWFCKLLKIPVINSVAGIGYVGSNGLKPKIGKILLKLTQPYADHVIFQNNDDSKFYQDNALVNVNKISHVNGIGIDLKKFTPQSSKDDGVVRFVLCARLLKTKGIIEFVEAANIVSNYFEAKNASESTSYKVHFALLGFIDTANPDAIHQKVLGYWHTGSSVRYLGVTDDVLNVIKDYDCVVLPSFYREGIPQSLIEACAMAKPIITTDNVGCRETVIDQQTGYIVPPKNIDKLADAMINMTMLTHDQRLKMGMQGRKKAEKEFCHLIVTKHYIEIINSVMA